MQHRIYLPKRSSYSYCERVFTMSLWSFGTIKFGTPRFHQRYRPNWPATALATSLLFCLLFVCLLLFGLAVQPVRAQTPNEQPLTIVAVDMNQFPTVALTIDGADWPEERANAPLQILVDGEEQTIDADRLMPQGISFMVAINPNDLYMNGQAGQTRYVQMTGAMLDLIDNEILLRYQDWMAAYLLLPTEVQSIQEWTQEPNNVFNSIALNRPPELTATPLAAATLITALQQFEASPAPAAQPRSLLLISTYAEGLDVAAVVAAAQTLAVQIHIVELPNDENPTTGESALAQIAQQTGGDYIVLDSPNTLPPLWQRIGADHNRRVLTFQSSVATPQSLEVRLPLPAGEPLSVTADPALLTVPSAIAAGAAPSVQNVMTGADAQVAVANAEPVTSSEASTTAAQPEQPAEEVAVAATQPVLTAQGPPSETAIAETAPAPGAIVIPGLQVAVPRGVLQISLPVLLVLIGYFVYAEVRERRKKRKRSSQRGQRADERYQAPDHFVLDDNSQQLSANPFQLNEREGKADQDFAVDTPARVTPQPKVTPQAPVRPPVRPTTFVQEEDESEATMRPRMEDDEATYRVQEVEQPTIGFLIRATSDPNLPKELPVYGLNPAPGEVRQIHIGRHSKHNTVVINDKSISREHAVIIQREGRLYLRDNASTSGTFLNWKRLNPGEELLLRHNDLISFGQIVYEFRLQGEDEVTIG